MKIEFDLNWKGVVISFVIVVIAFGIGFLSGLRTVPETGPVTNCLTVSDLNRSDIATGIILSRFCEGMGLNSSIFWQQDQNGNVYGLPICVQRAEV